MARLIVDYMSAALKRTVTVSVLLPVDKIDSQKGYMMSDKQGFKTLYLLHGLLGNHADWINGTRIQTWAQEKNLAVIMPSGDNSFYVEQPGLDADYGEFIGRELVEMTRKMFPLSSRREDTFIGGLSMGGFGALRNGIKYADTFGYIAAVSSALSIFETHRGKGSRVRFNEDRVFGGIENARNTDKNPSDIRVVTIKKL